MLFMLASVAVIADILFWGSSTFATNLIEPDAGPSKALRGPDTFKWIVAGVFAGLAMLSKYHGVFVLAGTFLFLLTSPPHRKWLLRPGPYVGAAIAIAMFAPVIIWNREHGWTSFVFQGTRATGRGGIHLGFDAGEYRRSGGVCVAVDLGAAGRRTLESVQRRAGGGQALVSALCRHRADCRVHAESRCGGDPGLPHWEARRAI